jgi:hypothetical protein
MSWTLLNKMFYKISMKCHEFMFTIKDNFKKNPLFWFVYYFQNYDRMHSLTLSYRISEAEYWKNDFATILKSFRLTNINR